MTSTYDKYQELEYKYNADHILLSNFRKLMEKQDYVRQFTASSWDNYHDLESLPDRFIRFREDVLNPELTVKVKKKPENNWHRLEVDAVLGKGQAENITQFLTNIGADKNFTIYKTCVIYLFDNLSYVYYVVYNEELQEKLRCIEVEVRKDKIPELLDPKATLNEGEFILRELGITPAHRMKLSIYERFRR